MKFFSVRLFLVALLCSPGFAGLAQIDEWGFQRVNFWLQGQVVTKAYLLCNQGTFFNLQLKDANDKLVFSTSRQEPCPSGSQRCTRFIEHQMVEVEVEDLYLPDCRRSRILSLRQISTR